MRKYIPFLIALVIVQGSLQWLDVEVGSTFLWWFLDAIILLFFFYCKENKQLEIPYIIRIYLFWIVISALRGIYYAEGYWDYKSLVSNFIHFIMPISICFFYLPQNFVKVSRTCLTLLPFLFLLFLPFVQPEAIGKMLLIIPPFLLFFLRLPFGQKLYLVIALICAFILGSLGSRSTIVRFIVASFFALFFYFGNSIFSKSKIKLAYYIMFSLPMILLLLALTGAFNIFNIGEEYKGEFTAKDAYENDKEEDLSSDTRTILYVEVLESALEGNYILLGHSLSRGYNSFVFGDTDLTSSKRGERYNCEVALLNVFTHLGLVGLVMYSLIFMLASWKAIFRSRSYSMKIVGLWVAYRWLFSWVEEFNRFDINYIFIWAFVAMCFSPYYLQMSDENYISIIKNCFPRILNKDGNKLSSNRSANI